MVRVYEEAHGRSGDDARARVVEQLESGAAWQKFRAFVAAQGGDLACVDEPQRLPQAPVVTPCPATSSGYVAAIDTEEVGMTIVDLGGGRLKKGDPIDPSVGLELAVRLGDWVTPGQPLAVVHAATPAAGEAACRRVQQAITVQAQAVQPPPLIHQII
jgi:thymidine phosphorylase